MVPNENLDGFRGRNAFTFIYVCICSWENPGSSQPNRDATRFLPEAFLRLTSCEST